MKKILLAAAVVSALVASTAASAANVYDKDGTTLNVNGRIEAQWYNAGSSNNYTGKTANNDSSIYNWARMGLEGRSKINDYATAFGYMEFDVGDGDQNASQFKARDQYIGVDFGKFGAVKTGRYKNIVSTVVTATDVLGGDGESGKAFVVGDSRNAGKLTYTWTGYGVLLGAEYQSAKDGYEEHGVVYNVEKGYSVIAGYTSPVVLFGPISIKAGYSYMDGQDDFSIKTEDGVTHEVKFVRTDVDNQSGYAASLAWGVPSQGLYLATEYSHNTTEYIGAKDDLKQTGVEFAAKYSFENGLSLATGYQYESYDDGKQDVKSSQIPVVAEYNFNPNFKVYAQANFGVSDTEKDNGEINHEHGINPTYGDGNTFAVGARYTF